MLSFYWAGYNRLIRYFTVEEILSRGLIRFFTAGRFGREETGVKRRFAETLSESPFYGFGLDVPGPFDNAYLEMFMHGGLVALLIYLFVILLFVYYLFKYKNSTSVKEGRLLGFLIILVVGGGIGAPTLTINRFSIVFWVLAGILLQLLFIASGGKKETKV